MEGREGEKEEGDCTAYSNHDFKSFICLLLAFISFAIYALSS